MIIRKVEPRIFFGMSFQPAVAVTGLRQVGKTTLVRHIQAKLGENCLYFDLEDERVLQKFSQDAATFLESVSEKTIILDEVQRMPELFPALRGLIDRDRRPGRFVLLGSASFALLKNTSESLTGRISYFELHPFQLDELPNRSDLDQLWFRGGLPESYLATSDEVQSKWMIDYIANYLERDFPQLGLSANPVLMRRLLTMLASMQGQLLNQSSISRSLGIRLNSLADYLDFLENALFIHRLQPYFTNIGKRLTKTPKVFLRDSGLVHSLLFLPDLKQLSEHAVAGGSWEGFVLAQVLPLLKPHQLPFFYRTADGSELDLVIEEAGKIRLAIEVKRSDTVKITKGTTTAVQDLGYPHLLLITPGSDNYLLRRGMEVCPVTMLPQKLEEYLS